MIVVPIKQRDAHIGVGEHAGRVQPAESSSDNDDARHSKCYRIRMATSGKPERLTSGPALGGVTNVVETACPLDCPDACSLSVTVQQRKIMKIDGSHRNPVTNGYICAKVRR